MPAQLSDATRSVR